MMGSKPPTVDELVRTIARSSIPTVVVEGGDDVVVYRWVEERFGFPTGSFLPCNGRDNLLQVYDRRAEFSRLKTAFIADKDMWLFTAVPSEYLGIVWTTGYSIENDLYAGSQLECLLDRDEARQFHCVLKAIARWFAFEVKQYRNGHDAHVEIHPNRIVRIGEIDIDPAFYFGRGMIEPEDAELLEIYAEYRLKIRGKALFELLERYLSSPRRSVKHTCMSLYETAFKLHHPNPYIARMVGEIQAYLS
jgi:hypothetical protein